jgi:hypothetical protein
MCGTYRTREDMRNANKILFGKSERKRSHNRSKRRYGNKFHPVKDYFVGRIGDKGSKIVNFCSFK